MASSWQYAQQWVPPSSEAPQRLNITALANGEFIANRFQGKTVIVTGCARGMGLGAATRLAHEGANVVGIDWLEEQGRQSFDALSEAGHSVRFIPGDVTDDNSCRRMVDTAVREFGGLDAAINNAGVMDGVYSGDPIDYASQKDLIFAPIHQASDDYWLKVMQVNTTGVFLSLRHELRQLLNQGRGGAIVNVASIAGLRGLAGNPAYVASKHAVNGLTKNAAIDYAPFGIRVNSVNMAATDTPMIARAGALVAAQMRESKSTGMGSLKTKSLLAFADQNSRAATIAEQVAIMLFLLSPESSNLTGGTYATDGGWTTY